MHRLASFGVRLSNHIYALDSEESGQGLVEYAFILVLIALIVLIVVIILGNQTRNMFCNISGSFPH